MTITYALLTKAEANRLDPVRYNPTKAEFANLRLHAAPSVGDNDFVSAVAFDDERIIGKILFGYCSLPIDSESIKFALAEDLVVSEAYRGKGIGSSLIKKSMELGFPTIYSGISGMAWPLYQKLGFRSIDSTPAYQLCLSAKGMLRCARSEMYASSNKRAPGIGIAFSSIYRQHRVRRHALSNATSALTVRPAEAIPLLPSILEKRERRFQIPWDKDKLIRGINGLEENFVAWVLSVRNADGQHDYLVSAYRFEREVRLPLSSASLPMSEWRVNEIYPPVRDIDSARRLVAATAANLKGILADIVEFFAPTDALVSACVELDLVRSIQKSMLLVPSGVSDELKQNLLDPNQWWCRALNENQFEESQSNHDLLIPR